MQNYQKLLKRIQSQINKTKYNKLFDGIKININMRYSNTLM